MKASITILLCLMLLTPARFAAAAADINFSGKLVETPCVLDPKDGQIDIDVGSVIDKYLYSHQRSPGTPFAIHLLNCDLSLGKEVTIKFWGTSDELQPDFLKLFKGGAQGVAVGIETSENVFIPLFENIDFIGLQPGENIINLKVFVSAEKNAIAQKKIMPGAIETVADFFIEYQ
ncbi:fimbrial protein [Pantoea sp. BRR-3P]|uniref:fimbrial protein n=1 Tax=Pantoea sp. BRR-3P TaxID=3141541 RepID=UPI0031F50FEA